MSTVSLESKLDSGPRQEACADSPEVVVQPPPAHNDVRQLEQRAAKRARLDSPNTEDQPFTANNEALDLSAPHEGVPTNNNLNGSSNDESSKEIKNIHEQSSIDLRSMKFVRVLSVQTGKKTIFIEASYAGQKAVVILERMPLDEATTKKILENTDIPLQLDFFNDIYGNYFAHPPSDTSAVKVVIIHPATDKHIAKYSHQQLHLLNERAIDYEKITLPYLQSTQFSIDWVYNILDHQKEVERVVFEDPHSETGFILLPDLKWDGQQVDSLYLVAIVHRRGIKSLRDLRQEHLPLLKNIRQQSLDVIQKRWNLAANQIRAYLHYQPSYYHLHVHFTNIKQDAVAVAIGRSHLLDSVISSLEICDDFYARVDLPFIAREGDALLDKFRENQKAMGGEEVDQKKTVEEQK